jgi:putative hemolysin
MTAFLLAGCFLFLYAIFAGYSTALTTFRRQLMHNAEDQVFSISKAILAWFEEPQHEQNIPFFFQGVKLFFLLCEGAILLVWIQSWPLQTWFITLLPTLNQPASWIFSICNVALFLVFFLLIVILGEIVPYKTALLNPESYLVFGFPLLSICYSLFAGPLSGLEKFGNLFFTTRQQAAIHTRMALSASLEIRDIVNDTQTTNELPTSEREILSAVFDFSDMLVQDVTIPRTEVVAVEAQTTIRQALDLCLEKGMTKLPVYIDQLDNIEGIVHLRDIVLKLQEEPESSQPVVTLIRESLFVPDTIPLHSLLHQFRSQHMHMAIVLDEFGGTAGVVTLEDLLEAVFGEILDPFETISPAIQAQKDGSFLIDGRMTIDEFNETFHTKLSAPDYQTMAGYVLAQLNRIPQNGDAFEDAQEKLFVTVKNMDRLRVAQVLVQFYLPPVLEKSGQEIKPSLTQ